MMSYKGAKCYNDGKVDRYFLPGTEPEGFVLGSLYNGHNKGYVGYYNAQLKKSIKIPAGSVPPEGYTLGIDPGARERQTATARARKSNQNNVKGKKWFNNGTVQIRVDTGKDSLPEGFVPGRLPMSEEQRLKIGKAMLEREVSEATRQKHRESNYQRIAEKGAFGLGTKRTDAFKRRQSEILSSSACQQKRRKTCLENNSFNKSSPEEVFYQALLELFRCEDVHRQYSDSRYPFACDFYIKSLDMFVECNFHWTHGKHRFSPQSAEDQKELQRILTKINSSKFYKNYYEVWTMRDVNKVKVAESNSINYITLYNSTEAQEFLRDLRAQAVHSN